MDPVNESAYADYVEQSWPTLVRAAVFLGARPHEAEDLAQTTLVRCYTGWERVNNAENRDAYVYRMLLNCLRDVRRTRWWKDRQYDDPAALARRWTRANAVMVNASVTRLLVGSTGARVLTLNEHPHLAGDAVTYR